MKPSQIRCRGEGATETGKSESAVNPLSGFRIGFLLVTMLLTNIGFGVILPILPFLSRKLNATSFQTGLAFSVFALAQLFASPFWGRLSDRVGRRRILVIGVIGYGISSALLGIAPNMMIFLMFRFTGGFFSAAVFPSAQALIADWTKPEHRTRILGYMSSMNGIGFIIGPSVGSSLAVFGYEIPFLGVGILSILNGILAFRFLPGFQQAALQPVLSKSFDSKGNTGKYLSWIPVFPFLLSAFIFSIADASISSTLAYFFSDHLKSVPAFSGFAFTINGAAAALYQIILLPFLFERYGERITILAGFLFGTIGYLGLSLSSTAVSACIWIVLLAGSRGLVFPTITSAISVRVSRHSQGISMGWQQTSNSLGRTLGPILAGWVFGYDVRFPYLLSAVLMMFMICFFSVSAFAAHYRAKHSKREATALPKGKEGDAIN